jgi:hypothetical protein
MESAQLWVELPLICALSVSRRRAWPCQHWVLSPCIRSCIRSVPAGRSANPTEWSKTKLRLDCDGWRAIIARAAALSTPEGTPRWKRRPISEVCRTGV